MNENKHYTELRILW